MQSKNRQKRKADKTRRRAHRVRVRIGADRPRLSVFRSAKHIFVQVIDDTAGKTLVAASDTGIKKGTKVERALEVGKLIAERAKTKGIIRVVFDRGAYAYHGRVKAVADGARAGGLEF